jgi:hypothetical protein
LTNIWWGLKFGWTGSLKSDDVPTKIYHGNLVQGAVDEAEEEAAVAMSREFIRHH